MRALLTVSQSGYVVIDIPDYGREPRWPVRWPVFALRAVDKC